MRKFLLATMAILWLLAVLGGRLVAQENIAVWKFPSGVTDVTCVSDMISTTDCSFSSEGTVSTSGTNNPNTSLCGDTDNTKSLQVSGQAGGSVIFKISAASYRNISVSYDLRCHPTMSNGGYSNYVWSYSFDGINYLNAPAGTAISDFTATTFTAETADFSTITNMNGRSAIWFKLTMSGATGTSVASNIDNVVFSGIPMTCLAPVNVTAVANDSPNEAVVSWEPQGVNVESYTLVYYDGTVNQSALTTMANANYNSIANATSPQTITGLDANTTYYIYVRANCGGSDVSLWSEPARVKTPAVCTISNFGIEALGGSTTTLSWATRADNTMVRVFSVQPENPWETSDNIVFEQTVSDTLCVVTGLEFSTTYYAYAKSVCSPNNISESSNMVTFTTNFADNVRMVNIGEGTTTNSYLPTYSFYSYTLSQQIYTPEEIGTGGSIVRIAFFNGGSEKTRSIDMYMLNSSKQTFSSSSDWVAATSNDLVYSGSVTFAVGDWTTIELDTPFEYDGESNLIVVVDDNTGSYSSGLSCRVFDAPSKAIRVYNDATNYNPASPSSYSGSVMSVKNQLQIVIIPTLPPTCPKPTLLAASNVASTSATLTWVAGGAEHEWILKYGESGFDVETEGTTVNPTDTVVNLSGLTATTAYDVYLKAVCAEDDQSGWTMCSFTTTCDVITELPFEEGFESAGSGSLPQCWTKVGAGTVAAYTSNPHTGSYSMRFSGATGNNVVALPQFGTNISSLVLSFYTRPESVTSSNCGTFEVGYITDLNDISTFTAVETYSYNDWASVAYKQKNVVMTNAPEGSYFAMNHRAGSTVWYWFVDDLVVRIPSTDAEITAFSLEEQASAAVINSEAATVTTTVSYQTESLAALVPTITVSDNATIAPASNVAQDFSSPVTYVVTAEDGTTTKEWTVNVTMETVASSAKDIIAFSFSNQQGESIIDAENHTVTAYAAWNYNFTNNIAPTIAVSPQASIYPASDSALNFAAPVTYTVTAEDSSTQAWVVTIVNDPNVCVNPLASTIEANDLGSTTVTIAWERRYTETSYNVKVSSTAMTDMTATADVFDGVVNDTTIALTGLAENTQYYMYVQSACGVEGWASYMFRTIVEPATIPYIYGFEEPAENNQWILINGTQTNKWYIDTVSNNGGEYGLYISSDNGTSNVYNNGSISYVYAYRTVNFPANSDYIVSFDWKANGENNYYDYIRAWLVPASVSFTPGQLPNGASSLYEMYSISPEGWISLEENSGLNQVTTWQNNTQAISVPNGLYNVVFLWANDGSIGSNPPASIDNISITQITCPVVDSLMARNITQTSADITWRERGNATAWDVVSSTTALTDEQLASATSVVASATSYQLTELTQNTLYYVYVRANCSAEDQSGWMSISFHTECGEQTIPYSENFTDYTATSYSTAGVMPNCWNEIYSGTSQNYSPHVCNYEYYAPGSDNYLVLVAAQNETVGQYSYAILPLVEGGYAGKNISFLKRISSVSNGTLALGYMNGENFVSLTDVTLTATGSSFSYVVPNNVPTDAMLAFKLTASSTSYVYLGIDNVLVRELSSEAEITGLTLAEQATPAVIDSENASVSITVSYTTESLDSLVPAITISDYATIAPLSGVAQNFNDPVTYIVTAEDGTTKNWTITVTKETVASSAKDILTFSFNNQRGESVIDTENRTVTAYTAWNYNFSTNITPAITVSPLASISPESGIARNFAEPVMYTVTAEDSTTQDWTVTILHDPNQCVNPLASSMVVRDLTSTSATVVWVKRYSENETLFNVKVSTTAIAAADLATASADFYDGVVNDTAIILSGLDESTTYYVYVQTACGIETWINTSFYTGVCIPAPTSVDNNGITNVTFGMGEHIVNNNTHPTSSPYFGDYTAQIGSVAASKTLNVNVTYATGYTYGTVIWVNWNNDVEFTSDEIVAFGTSTSTSPTTLQLSFTVPANTPVGNYRMRIGGADSQFDSEAGRTPCSSTSYTIYEDYTLMVTPAPLCLPVSDIEASDISSSSATISWNENGPATAWQIIVSETEIDYDDLDATVAVPVTDTFYNVTGLSETTDYYVYVRSHCSEYDNGDWVEYAFSTVAPCPTPENMTASPVYATSAIISWRGYTASLWTLEYKEGISTEWTVVEGITSATYTLATTPNTPYLVRVKAVCDGIGEGEYSETLIFSTPCSALDLPYSEDLESYNATAYYTAGVMPDCWDVIYSGTSSGYSPHVSTSYVPSGKGIVMTSGTSVYYGSNNYVIMPLFETATEPLVVEFDYKMYSETNGTLDFGYMTSTNASSFVSLQQLTNQTVSTHAQVNMSNLSEGARFAFRWSNAASYSSYCGIDNIFVREMSTDNTILSYAAVTAQGNAICEVNNEAHTISVVLRTGYVAGSNVSQTVTLNNEYATVKQQVGASFVTVPTGFRWYMTDADTTLTYKVIAENGDEELYTATVTVEECASPFNLISEQTVPESVTLSWSAVEGTSNWDYYCTTTQMSQNELNALAASEYNTVAATSVTYDVAGETTYYWYVRTNCGESFSAWMGGSFTSWETCTPPANITAQLVDNNNIVLSWDALTNLPIISEEIVDDFERGSIGGGSFTYTNSSSPLAWSVVSTESHTGSSCMKSASGNNSATSEISMTINNSSTSTFSFWYKVSSESGYDAFYFMIDGTNVINGVSGEIAWTQYSTTLSAGNHTLSWKYIKDSSVGSGSDCVWVDDIYLFASYVSEESHYVIYKNDEELAVLPGSQTTYTDENLVDGNYCYAIKTICRQGNESALSGSVCQEVNSCYAVTELAVDDVTDNSVELSWTRGSNETAWNLILNGGSPIAISESTDDVTVDGDDIVYVLGGLNPNTDYTIVVQTNCDGTLGLELPSVQISTEHIPATLPFVCDFEDAVENSDWELSNGTQTNKWYIGTAANNGGANGLYISDNNGASNRYETEEAESYVYAYRLFNVEEAGNYDISFDWRSNGEEEYDFLRAFVVPTSVATDFLAGDDNGIEAYSEGYVPAGWIDIANPAGVLDTETEWQHSEKTLSLAAGRYNIVFFWENDYSDGEQAPAAIDNVRVRSSVFIVTSSRTGLGTISPEGETEVVDGGQYQLTVAPMDGFMLESLMVNNVNYVDSLVNNVLTLTVHSNLTIVANFDVPHTISASVSGVGGTITPSGLVQVGNGESMTISVAANVGYVISSVLVDGEQMIEGGATAERVSYSHTFINVREDHMIIAAFEVAPSHTIMATASEGGSITPSGEVTVLYNASQTFEFAANEGYRLSRVTVDTTRDVTALVQNNAYTFTNVITNHTINATFVANNYNLTIHYVYADNRTAAPDHTESVTFGTTYSVVSPEITGYTADIDTAAGTMPAGDVELTVTYNVNSYNLTIHYVYADNTLAAQDYTAIVNYGDTYSVESPVIPHYTADQTIVSGTMPAEDKEVTVTYNAITFTITATAGANGTITPNGAVSVNEGADQSFAIAANTGYHIVSVLVDGESVGAVESYTFPNVNADHTIEATFEANTFTITATAGENGTITPNGEVSVNEGSSQTFTIAANAGYHIADVLVDGESVGAVESYTFPNVIANHTINATFEVNTQNTFTITATAGENGTITPSGAITVNEGTSMTFTIAANAGYRIADVLVDGQSVGAVGSYTFQNVIADHTIEASFEASSSNTYNIIATAGANGTITPNGVVTVNEGTNKTFRIAPNEGYRIASVMVDNVEAITDVVDNEYVFYNVTANHTINVTFTDGNAVDEYTTASMSVYPNPNNGMFSIEFANINGDATYQLIDARGALVETRDINVMDGDTMNFNYDLRPGTYFVRIITADKVYVEQIVVE
ncbi:MAG: fibronectin type III domain-containing protein [Bacteroidales bacterium]|nr:fibronectin type III domain-containing protein [Bacteroidales bacterium]